jgi:hypothetical protein
MHYAKWCTTIATTRQPAVALRCSAQPFWKFSGAHPRLRSLPTPKCGALMRRKSPPRLSYGLCTVPHAPATETICPQYSDQTVAATAALDRWGRRESLGPASKDSPHPRPASNKRRNVQRFSEFPVVSRGLDRDQNARALPDRNGPRWLRPLNPGDRPTTGSAYTFAVRP